MSSSGEDSPLTRSSSGSRWSFLKSFKNSPQKFGSVVLPEVNDYEFDRERLQVYSILAAGTSGDVHYGSYDETPVVVKIYHNSKNEKENDGYVQQFLQESSVLATLSCPYVVNFVGSYESGEERVVVTELVSGGNLKQYLKRQGSTKLTQKQISKMALEIARGMAYIHSKNVIHCSLKSENILIETVGPVKITDFSNSKFFLDTDGLPNEGESCQWMAPEAIRGGQFDSKVDVYSFGIVLWELHTRKVPFEGMSDVQVAFGVASKNLRPTIPDDCTPAMKKLMTACWENDPSKRPNFLEVVSMLESSESHKRGSLLTFKSSR